MIKIYTEVNLLTPKNRRVVFPLLLDLCYLFNQRLLEKYKLVAIIEDCDVVILPLEVSYFYKENKSIWMNDFIDNALAINKKVWIYSGSDIGLTVHKNVYTFRLGGMNSKLNNATFIFPAFIEDPLKINKKIYIGLPKPQVPVIGFVGNANGSASKWIKEFFIFLFINIKLFFKLDYHDYQPFYPSSNKRFHFLNALKKNNKIKTDFILRKKYRAGAKTDEEKEETTLVFINNVYKNPYTFCVRGAGNFSIRFYETLAQGRIPLIIDTDIRLPLDNIIDWKNHCVLANKDNFIQVLIDFHNNISESDFKKMQDDNRNLWLNYLTRESYFLRLSLIFNNLK